MTTGPERSSRFGTGHVAGVQPASRQGFVERLDRNRRRPAPVADRKSDRFQRDRSPVTAGAGRSRSQVSVMGLPDGVSTHSSPLRLGVATSTGRGTSRNAAQSRTSRATSPTPTVARHRPARAGHPRIPRLVQPPTHPRRDRRHATRRERNQPLPSPGPKRRGRNQVKQPPLDPGRFSSGYDWVRMVSRSCRFFSMNA